MVTAPSPVTDRASEAWAVSSVMLSARAAPTAMSPLAAPLAFVVELAVWSAVTLSAPVPSASVPPVPIDAVVVTVGIDTAATGVIAFPFAVPPSTSLVMVSVVLARRVKSLAFAIDAPSSILAEVVMSSMLIPTDAPKPVVSPPPVTFALAVTLLSVVDSALISTSVPPTLSVNDAGDAM